MLIRETIHHGNYRNIRELDIPATLDGFVSALVSSPYGGHSTDWYQNNQYVHQAAHELFFKGRTSFGWANYDTVSP